MKPEEPSTVVPRPVRYRADIDGVRAIAVLSVIFFHADEGLLPGGFIGVDIFFVISGFLITGMIVRDMEARAFRFADFYARRARRIVPAALTMTVITVCLGALFLNPPQFVQLAESAVATLLFISNFYFMENTGYFDQAANLMPLLHMWSLGVEEQFYLLFPFLLFIIFRVGGKRAVKIFALCLFVVSLSAALMASQIYPKFTFYMLPTRAWQLGLGAMIALFPIVLDRYRLAASCVFLFGLAMIAWSLWFLDSAHPHPGPLSMVPAAGTAMMIATGAVSGNWPARLIASAPLVLVGKFSYSAYLWHWPIVVYYRIYVFDRPFTEIETAALIIASLIFGFLSWWFIERTTRRAVVAPIAALRWTALASGIALAAPATVLVADGFPSRVPSEVINMTDPEIMWRWDCAERRHFSGVGTLCVTGLPWDHAAVKGIIWGDSHAEHWAPVFHHLAIRRNMSFAVWLRSCPPSVHIDTVRRDYPRVPKFTENCSEKRDTTVERLNKSDDVQIIVMAAAWSGYLSSLYLADSPDKRSRKLGGEYTRSGLEKLLTTLDLKDKHLLLLGDVPRPMVILNDCAAQALATVLRAPCGIHTDHLDWQRVTRWHEPSNAALRDVARQNPKIDVILPSQVLCREDDCSTYLNNEFLFRDANHIRRNLSPDTLVEIGDRIGLASYLDRFSAQ